MGKYYLYKSSIGTSENTSEDRRRYYKVFFTFAQLTETEHIYIVWYYCRGRRSRWYEQSKYFNTIEEAKQCYINFINKCEDRIK